MLTLIPNQATFRQLLQGSLAKTHANAALQRELLRLFAAQRKKVFLQVPAFNL